MNNEKLVKFNGIPISPSTGFKNLIFETSRYSQGLNTIRGFGETLSESNLSNIENVMIEFVLKAEELKDLAFVYSLFRALGCLTIENEYLLNKIGTSITNGNAIWKLNATEEELAFDKDASKNKEYIKNLKNKWIKFGLKYLCVFLENMRIKSLPKTSDGYQVSLVLSLYKNGFTEDEYKKYIETFNDWNNKTKFSEIKKEISKQAELLKNTGIGLDLNYYNSQALNALYKDNLLSSSFKSFQISKEQSIENKMRTDDKADNKEIESLRNLLGIDNLDEVQSNDFNKIKKTISVPNRNIIQIEMITHNNISHIPIKGSPVIEKSLLGIGKTSFTMQMLFDEYDKDIVESLKTISDMNITDTKLEIEHPLIKLFDFHSGQILNIQFNNVEEANGILVTMVFNINGYRYKEESVLNNEDEIGKILSEDLSKTEKLSGSYLEILNTYVSNNIYRLNPNMINTFINSVFIDPPTSYSEGVKKLFSFIQTNRETQMNFFDLLSAYSTTETNEVIYKKNSKLSEKIYNKLTTNKTNYLRTRANSELNFQRFIELNYQNFKNNAVSDIVIVEHLFSIFDCSVELVYSAEISQNTIFLNTLSNNLINKNYLKNIARPLAKEMYNEKIYAGGYKFLILQKIYEEFFIRLDQVVYYNDFSKNLNEFKKEFKLNNMDFENIFKYIKNHSEKVFESFLSTLSNRIFLDRINKEITAYMRTEYDEERKDEVLYSEFKEEVSDIKKELTDKWNRNKEDIIRQVYNIFLIRLTYYNLTCLNEKGDYLLEYKRVGNISTMLFSTCLCTPLLVKTDDRTDTFNLIASYIFKSLGESITNYNYLLVDDLKKENKTQKIYWQTELQEGHISENYLSESNDYESYLYKLKNHTGKYMKETSYDDLFFTKEQLTNKLLRKDVNYFYGQLIPKVSFYSLLGENIYNNEVKDGIDSLEEFINKERNSFLEEEYSEVETMEENNIDVFELGNVGVYNIAFPSKLKENFTYTNTEENKSKINSIMKNRIIGNRDPFRDVLNISQIIKDNTDVISPDYFVLVNLDNETEGQSHYLQIKNITNISISKNPKTKIKTAVLTIANANKNFFNVNVTDGSFSIKTMKNGIIKSYAIKPGLEIRISLGYTFKDTYTLFNGIISTIQEYGNTISLGCTSFSSELYNYIPFNLKLSNNSLITDYASDYKTVSDETSNAEITQEGNDTGTAIVRQKDRLLVTQNPYEALISNARLGVNNLNSHLFGGFSLGEDISKKVFSNLTTSSYSLATQIMMLKMPDKIAKYFSRTFKEDSLNQDTSYLGAIYEFKHATKEAFGTSQDLDKQESGISSLTNIYDVDIDYETYGIVLKDSDNKILSVTSGKNDYNAQYSNSSYTIDGKNIDEEKTNNTNTNISQVLTKGNLTLFVSPLDMSKMKTPFNGQKFYDRNGKHAGVDWTPINNEKSNPHEVKAVADGTVTLAQWSDTLGYFVKIQHNDGITYTVYGHLSDTNKKLTSITSGVSSKGSYTLFGIKVGSKVKAGQTIAILGSSGRSTGAHLHFGVGFTSKDKSQEILNQIKDSSEYNKYIISTSVMGRLKAYVDPMLYLSKNPVLGIFSKEQNDNKVTDTISDLLSKAVKQLKHFEGFVPTPYQDANNTKSIGYGFNENGPIKNMINEDEYNKYFKLGVPITRERADELLGEMLETKEKAFLKDIGKTDWNNLNEGTKIALLDMAYNTGKNLVKVFPKMVEAILNNDLETAEKEFKNSSYYKNHPHRERVEKNLKLITGSE